jgi:hypothetical protein
MLLCNIDEGGEREGAIRGEKEKNEREEEEKKKKKN